MLPASQTLHPPQPPPPLAPKRKRGASPVRRRGASPTRSRGGQPGNQNARKFGTYSRHQPGPFAPVRENIARLRTKRCYHGDLDAFRQEVSETFTLLESIPLCTDREGQAVLDYQVQLGLLAADVALEYYIPEIQFKQLRAIVRDPLGWILKGFHRWGITRDADSFLDVSEKGARFSPLPPDHPHLATNLTEDQWSLLQPLIPPDPYHDFVCSQPPVIIAANRWGFSRYTPGDEAADIKVMGEHDRILRRAPGLLGPPVGKRPRKRVYSQRALLDAIFWKLATGHTWDKLPAAFPPMRTCRKYYRRLFQSGRLYTLLLALYNHMRFELGVDPWTLYEEGYITTTPNRRIALVPGTPPTSVNYTALLFLQLARNAWTTLENDRSRELPAEYRLTLPAGYAPLSDARLFESEVQDRLSSLTGSSTERVSIPIRPSLVPTQGRRNPAGRDGIRFQSIVECPSRTHARPVVSEESASRKLPSRLPSCPPSGSSWPTALPVQTPPGKYPSFIIPRILDSVASRGPP